MGDRELLRIGISKENDPLALLVLLFIRGVLLWLLVPLGFVVWVLGAVWLIGRGATLGKFLGWLDSNFIIILERTLLRPFFAEPTHPWVPFADIAGVTHRVGPLDLF